MPHARMLKSRASLKYSLEYYRNQNLMIESFQSLINGIYSTYTFNTNIKLSSKYLTTMQNDHTMPLYSGMFHKLLNTFLDAMIAKEQTLINNLAGQSQ